MKSILIPVGFTSDSTNAARYGIQLAAQFGYSKVVLYNVYEAPFIPTPDPMSSFVTSLPFIDVAEYKKISESGLARLKEELKAVSTAVEIDTISEIGNLSGFQINEIATKTGADMVVMGISSADFLDQALIGSNAVHVAKEINLPVIAVPAKAVFKPFANITLACDLKKVADTVPSDAIKNLLNTTKAHFSVLHIGEENEVSTAENNTLHKLFEVYKPEYYFVDNNNFTEAINTFIEEQKIDLVITIPKKHGWLEGLFKQSHLKSLAFHSHVPLFIMHD